MFEQKSDKKLMTTVVLGWRRAAERGRMERRQGDEMAAAAAAAAAVEEQQMAVKEHGEGEERAHSAQFCAILRAIFDMNLYSLYRFASNMLGVRTTAL